MENAEKERFELAMLDEYVAVNHWGTILTKTEIPMAEGGRPGGLWYGSPWSMWGRNHFNC